MIRIFSLFLIGAKKINKGKKYPARVPGEFSFILRLCDHHSDHNDDDDDDNCPPRTPKCGLFPARVKRGRGKGSQAYSPKRKKRPNCGRGQGQRGNMKEGKI